MLVMFPSTQDLVEFMHTTVSIWPSLNHGLERAKELTLVKTDSVNGVWTTVSECIGFSTSAAHTDPSVVVTHKLALTVEEREKWQRSTFEVFTAWMRDLTSNASVSVMVLPPETSQPIPLVTIDESQAESQPEIEATDIPLTVGQLLMQETNADGLNQPPLVISQEGVTMAIPNNLASVAAENVIVVPSPVVEIESGDTVGVALQFVNVGEEAPAEVPVEAKEVATTTADSSSETSRSSRSTLKSRASSLRITVPTPPKPVEKPKLERVDEDDDDKPLNMVAMRLGDQADGRPLQFVQTQTGVFPVMSNNIMGPPVFVSSQTMPQMVSHSVIPGVQDLGRAESRRSGASLSTIPFERSTPGNVSGFSDVLDFDDNASTRARKLLAAAWLEREREKERQRARERMMERIRTTGVNPMNSMNHMGLNGMQMMMQQQMLQQSLLQQQMIQQSLMQSMALGMLPSTMGQMPGMMGMPMAQMPNMNMAQMPNMGQLPSMPSMNAMGQIPSMNSMSQLLQKTNMPMPPPPGQQGQR